MNLSEEDFDKRLNKLGKSIDSAKGSGDNQAIFEHKKHIKSTLLNHGIELFSCVLVGSVFGFFIDKYFNTRPLFIILGFVFGLVVSFYNIIKVVKG